MTTSCGLLMYALSSEGVLSVLLAHPGGPYWRGKDIGAWSIPKGLPEEGEEPLVSAQREFFEETGVRPKPPFLALTPIRQKGGKLVQCWAFEGREAPARAGASAFEIEWPPRSGRLARFPEVDAVRWFPLDQAREKILPAQRPLLDELEAKLA